MSGPTRSTAGLALASVLLGACIGGGALPVTHYYTLRPPAEAASAAAGGAPGLVVGVRSFAVDPPYDQDRLVYRHGSDATEVGFYNYHRWAAPLGRLIAVALADGLRGTAGLASIEPARASAEYSASLSGRLIYLEEVDSASGQEARMSLELALTDQDGLTLWSSTLAGSAVGNAGEVSQVMELIQLAFDRVVAQASAEIAGALETSANAASSQTR